MTWKIMRASDASVYIYISLENIATYGNITIY